MRKFFFILILTILQISSAFTSELKGTIEIKSIGKYMRMGAIVDLNIMIHPYDGDEKKIFKDLINKKFLDIFYIVEILKVERSQNNYDVVKASLRGILVSDSRPKFFIWSIDDINIPLDIVGDFNPLKKTSLLFNQNLDVLIQNIDVQQESSLKIILLACLLISVFLMILFRKNILNMIKEFIQRKRDEKELKEWKEIFKKASKRKEFEDIYNSKKKWPRFLSPENKVLADKFLLELNQIQYKKDWTDIEQEKIKKTLNLIRESL